MSTFRLSHALTLKKDTETQLKVCHDRLHQDLRESEINEHKVKIKLSEFIFANLKETSL